jgi:hypothetical protein
MDGSSKQRHLLLLLLRLRRLRIWQHRGLLRVSA